MTSTTTTTSRPAGRVGGPLWLVGMALVAVAVVAAVFGLVLAGGSYQTALPGLPDPGPLVGWGTPVLRLS